MVFKITLDVVIKEQNCGCKEFKELRVAFGNLDNCQLKCPFCFTFEQKSPTDILTSVIHRITGNVKVIRFTGGEPLISQDQIDGIETIINKIKKKHFPNLDLIIIQTNAINIEKRNIPLFENQELPILFEISFKGTNISEYKYLTFNYPISDQKAKLIFNKQIIGYKHLVNKFANYKKINVLARLGIFHSSINKPTFKFVFPFDQTKLMFNPESWDSKIFELLDDQKRIWNSKFNEKLVIERLKNPGQGSPGMGKRYRTIIDLLKSKNLLVEDKKKPLLPKQFRCNYVYKNGDDIYKIALSNLV